MIPYNLEEILPLLEEQVRKYTSNESTSISYLTAQRLMGSVIYSIEAVFEQTEQESFSIFSPLEEMDPRQVYQLGYRLRKEKITKALAIYQDIRKNFCDYQNLCYYDTIEKGFPMFFERYDLAYDATNAILTLDYPLIQENRNLQGIDLIYDYLVKTKLEQRFLNKFPIEHIRNLLYNYDKNYKELIFNLCDMVLKNALGCMLAKNPAFDLYLNKKDRENICNLCKEVSLEGLEELISSRLEQFLMREYPKERKLLNYLTSYIEDVAYEITFCCRENCLQRIFPEKREKQSCSNNIYTEGKSMEDEQLRKLIAEMANMRYLSDKIMLIQNQVKNLSDLKEILKECFFLNEWKAVFMLLNDSEIHILSDEIYQKKSFGKTLEEWESAFLEFCKK